jgi:hypothetical protein
VTTKPCLRFYRTYLSPSDLCEIANRELIPWRDRTAPTSGHWSIEVGNHYIELTTTYRTPPSRWVRAVASEPDSLEPAQAIAKTIGSDLLVLILSALTSVAPGASSEDKPDNTLVNPAFFVAVKTAYSTLELIGLAVQPSVSYWREICLLVERQIDNVNPNLPT